MLDTTLGRTGTLQDVATWTRANRCIDTYRAVARCATLWAHGSPARLPADPDALEQRFPRDGYDPDLHKSEPAYRAWRVKVLSALHAYAARDAVVTSGSTSQTPETQIWEDLKARIRRLTGEDGPITYQATLPVVALSHIAIQRRLRPSDLDAARLAALGPVLTSNERQQVLRALKALTRFREVAALDDLLPLEPFPTRPWPPRARIDSLPVPLRDEIAAWVDKASGAVFDPVAQTMAGGNSRADQVIKETALRRYCAAARKLEAVAQPDAPLKVFFCKEVAVAVVRDWRNDGLSSRTIWSYLRNSVTVAARNGVDVSWLAELKDRSNTIKEGQKSSGAMSPKVMKFCKKVLDQPQLQIRLLTLHVRARRIAQVIVDRAHKEDRDLTGREVERVRQIGSVAVFSAIETVAAPFRIENTLSTVFRGDADRTLFLPTTASSFGRFVFPGMVTKNREQIEVKLIEDRRHGLDTLLWYLRVIRPLYPHHERSDFLFPGVDKPGQRIRNTVFREWFRKVTRALGLPMTPHNFRHALDSMMIQARPGSWDEIAALLGNTPETVMKYYAWINKQTQVEKAQSLVLELLDAP